MRYSFIQLITLAVLSIFLSACNGDCLVSCSDSTSGDSSTPIDQIITFAEAGPRDVLVGDTFSNPASGIGSGDIIYSSTDLNVATVDASGLVTVIGVGTATITADKAADEQYAAASASYTLSALNPQSVSFSQSGSVNILVGDTLANSLSSNGTGVITYSSSNPEVAAVDSSGVVTVISAGSAVITATQAADAQYAASSSSYTINAMMNQAIAFERLDTSTVLVGETFSNPATSVGTGVITYSSSNPDVATVDGNGLVTVLAPGSATITVHQAADDDYAATSASYTIGARTSQLISFSQPESVSVLVGDTLTNPASGGEGSGTISYSSSDLAVAEVDSAGRVEVNGAGSVTITANKTADDVYAAASASYTLNARFNQVISFSQLGPLDVLVGEAVDNPASGGGGSSAITYSSSNPNVAEVDEAGLLEVNGAGSVTITASKAADDVYAAASASYTLNARFNQEISFSRLGPLDVLVDEVIDNPASGGGGSGAITYSSSNPNVAEVNDAGLLEVKGPGTATITASKAADSEYVAATASYTLSALIGQTISFSLAGPFDVLVGEEVDNPASGGEGSGAITYSSSNPDIAEVDGAGQVEVKGSGSVTITASKAADNDYAAAAISYALNAAPTSVAIAAWVGVSDTQVNFPASASGLSFYRSTEANCDVSNYSNCANGQLDVVADSSITDSAMTLSQSAHYTLEHGAKQAALAVSSASFEARHSHQMVSFSDRLWIVGGNSLKNDVWASSDGVVWFQQTANAAFSARSHHQVVVFNNKLWLIGGNDGTNKNDVWSSEDGITWTEHVAVNPKFSARTEHQVTVFKNQMWLIGGSDGSLKDDVWSSSDGIEWTEHLTSEIKFSAREKHQVAAFNNQLWLIGGNDGANRNDVWSSSDGIDWTEQVTPDTKFAPRTDYQVEAMDDRLWLIGGNLGASDVWSSADGIDWDRLASSVAYSSRTDYRTTVFGNELWLTGGRLNGRPYGDSWSSADGITWVPKTASASFSARAGMQVKAFNDELWVTAGIGIGGRKNDVWSSVDGISWTQQVANAPFSMRLFHQVVAFNDRLWLIGGNEGGLKNDVWSSSDGVEWLLETEAAEFSARAEHQVVIFKNQFWLIGGYDGSLKNDVWSSNDGTTWTEVSANAGFSARKRHQVVVFDNALWVIAGDDGGRQRDVWSSFNGIDWTQVTSSAGFPPLYGHQVVVFDSQLWLIAGNGGAGRINEIWSSSDGALWTPRASNPAFSGRSTHEVEVFKDQLWLFGGDDGERRNDVWTSSHGIEWRKGFHGELRFQ